MLWFKFACLFLLFSMSEQADEGYLRVKCDANEGPEVINQGRPGKVGPAGLQGQKGEQGARGQQGEGVGELGETVRQLTERVQELEESERLIRKVTQCSVGMKLGGNIDDDQITSSSTWSAAYLPYHGRLDNTWSKSTRGAWIPSSSRREAGEWLQVDLFHSLVIHGVVTQGRSSSVQWVTGFTIQHGMLEESLSTIQDSEGNEKVFEGNTDASNYVVNMFPHPISARYFRLVVQTYHQLASLRMDYITC